MNDPQPPPPTAAEHPAANPRIEGGQFRRSIGDFNRLDQTTFIALLGHLFEDSPWIVADAWQQRPFGDRAALERAFAAVIAQAPRDRQVALIAAHPDLVGRAALTGSLGLASTAEQAAAGLDRDHLTPERIATFAELNRRYRDRFGFPFVICARENKETSILAGFRARLGHDREQEIATALAEIGKIAHYRLLDLLDGP